MLTSISKKADSDYLYNVLLHEPPTLFFQTCIAKHESNGIDIIIALIVNPINPLGKHRLDLVLELKVSCPGRSFIGFKGSSFVPLFQCVVLT